MLSSVFENSEAIGSVWPQIALASVPTFFDLVNDAGILWLLHDPRPWRVQHHGIKGP